MLPDFFVVGAAKSGTTSLYHFLDRHPDVYMSPIKEPNHFCTDIRIDEFSEEFKRHEREKNLDLSRYLAGDMKEKHWGYFVRERSDYLKLFRNITTEKAAGEVSNSYLFSHRAAANIRQEIPAAKIIMMLRNPSERAWSHYLANLRDGKTYLPFMDEIKKDAGKNPKGWGRSYLYLEMGLYYAQVKRYMDLFPAGQLKIFLYDDFKKDPGDVMNQLFEFIGVPSMSGDLFREKFNRARSPVSSRLLYFLSKTGIKRKLFRAIPAPFRKSVKDSFFKSSQPQLPGDDIKQYLAGYYRNDIVLLESLLGRSLQSWVE